MTSSDPINFKFNQTMLRIKDPEISIPFYRDVLGMTLLHRYDYEAMDFSLYFLGYEQELVGAIPPEGPETVSYTHLTLPTKRIV